jgi:hypothetical protein
MKKHLTTIVFVLAFSPLLRAQQVPPAPTLEQVLDNYPSRAELQAQVDAYQSAHTVDFDASRADFELAIRSMLTLEFPERPNKNRRHVERKPRALPNYYSRSTVVKQIERCRAVPEYSEWLAFYEQHIEEIVVDETPALRYVYLDVLLNGWDDWANWQGDELQEIRQKYPDLHVKYALKDMHRFRSTWDDLNFVADTFGLVLPLVLDMDRGRWVRDQARSVVTGFALVRKDVELLRFSINAAMNASDKDTRLDLLTISSAASHALPGPEYLEFWVDYLEAPDEWIRTKAVGGIVGRIRKPRPGEEPRPRDAELAQMLYDVLQNDPSPGVRNFLQPRLEQYERSDTKPSHGRGRIGGPITPIP